jgi:hypothetical protein
MSEELQNRLIDLGARVEWPDADLTGKVRSRLVEAPPSRLRPGWAIASALTGLVLLAIVTQHGRTAVADLLGVVGIDIRWSEVATPPTTHQDLALGQPIALDVAVGAADFVVLVPTGDIGPPDAVYSDDGRISTVWKPTATLPEVGDSGIGLLHMQFNARLDTGVLTKRIEDGTNVTAVEVRGRMGYWVDGEPHVLTYLLPDGYERMDTTRLAGNVLLWEEDGVTHRIESALSLDAVRWIAVTMADTQVSR